MDYHVFSVSAISLTARRPECLTQVFIGRAGGVIDPADAEAITLMMSRYLRPSRCDNSDDLVTEDDGQTPQAETRIKTSRGPGSGRGISTSWSGSGVSCIEPIALRIMAFIVTLLYRPYSKLPLVNS